MELAPMRFCWPLIGVGDAWPLKGRAKWHRRPRLQALPQQFQLLSPIIHRDLKPENIMIVTRHY